MIEKSPGIEGLSMKTNNLAKAGFLAAAVAVAAIIAISSIPLSNYTASTSPKGSGTLSLLIIDPPHLAANVTNVYLSFSSIKIHNTEANDNSSGWFAIGGAGTIDLTKVINLSKVVAVSKVPEGEYNLIRFNITSVVVTYNGKNYTASTPSSSLTVVIHPKLEVERDTLSAAVLDISPTVINTGSSTNPSFILIPAAHASPVPKSDVSEEMEHEGKDVDLRVKSWWKELEETFNTTISITSASLSQSSLSLTVKNTGKTSTTLKLVVVTPALLSHNSDMSNKDGREEHEVPLFFHSAIFFVEKNGSLLPVYKVIKLAENISEEEPLKEAVSEISQLGYNLSSEQSVTLSYNGPVIFFPPLPVISPAQPSPLIISGNQYRVTVIGTDAIASTIVTASNPTGNTGAVSFYVVTSRIHGDELFILFLNTGTEPLTSYTISFQNGNNISSSINPVQSGSLALIMHKLPFQVSENTKYLQITLTLVAENGASASEILQVQVVS
jgi:hypothetical protein